MVETIVETVSSKEGEETSIIYIIRGVDAGVLGIPVSNHVNVRGDVVEIKLNFAVPNVRFSTYNDVGKQGIGLVSSIPNAPTRASIEYTPVKPLFMDVVSISRPDLIVKLPSPPPSLGQSLGSINVSFDSKPNPITDVHLNSALPDPPAPARLGDLPSVNVSFESPSKGLFIMLGDVKLNASIALNVYEGGASTQVPQVSISTMTSPSSAFELSEGEVAEVGEVVDKVLFGLGRVVPDRPLVIIARRGDGFGYIEFLKRVLREVYRVRVGGLPSPKHLGHAEDLTLLMPIEVGAGGRLFVIDLTSGNLRELLKDSVRLARIRGRFRDRLRELFSQGFGFIVIYGDDEHRDYASNDYENIKDSKKENKEDYVSKFISGIWIKFFDENVALEYHSTVPSPIEVGPVIANSSREFYVFVASLMWGRVGGAVMSYDEVVRRFGGQQSDNDNKSRNSVEDAFDRFVVWLEDSYWRSLEGSVRDFDVQVLVRPSVEGDEGGRESMSHYLTKAFIVNYLIRELTEEFRSKGVAEDVARSRALECVETEYQHGNVRFDVYVKPDCGSRLGGLVVEVETLYGTGTVLHKVSNAIEGRIGAGVGKLWVVIPNPQAIIYLPQLLRLEMHVRRKYKGDIEFHTLDITSGAPVRLVDVARRLLSRWRELRGG
ncbi:MAG: hypothetical protein L7H08_05020 [Vulcanisaeta sp.]|nr:hypothetical protein [Vulcanisaeta sp.]